MNFGVLLGSIFAVLATSTVVAFKSYKNAPEPVESHRNYDHSNSTASDIIPSGDLELVVSDPVSEEVNTQ